MKNEQHQQAKNLFLETNLTKTEIANLLNVDRRTIRIWSQEGNWEQLRKSSKHLPAIVAEKVYYLIDHFTSYLLATAGTMATISTKDAEVIHKLANSIKKLKNRNTVNESMEMFNFFLEDLKRKNEQMALDVSPYMEQYIAGRKDIGINDFVLHGFDSNGLIPYSDKEVMEKWADDKEDELMRQELRDAINETGAQQSGPATVSEAA